jgi:hypothetical protein
MVNRASGRFVLIEAAATRLDEERARLAQVLADAAPPEACGDAIPVSPARGPMRRFTPREMAVTDAGGFRSVRSGYAGRDAACVMDAFDVMEVRRRAAAARHGRAYEPLFSVGQVEAARDYAALFERVASSGVKLSSLEGLGGGGDAGAREAAVFDDIARLRMLRRRIGGGLVDGLRSVRPGGAVRSSIRVIDAVDRVCVGRAVVSDVLAANGFAVNSRTRAGLCADLAAAFDRLRGFDLARGC